MATEAAVESSVAVQVRSVAREAALGPTECVARRNVATGAAVAAFGSVAGALCGYRNNSLQRLERC